MDIPYRIAKHVSVVWDVNANLDYFPVITACHHHLFVVPPSPVPIPQPFGLSLEQPATMMQVVGGWLLGLNKFTSSVYHNHVSIAQEGHDIGRLLLHVSVVPGLDILMQLHILNSSRKAKFRAGEVKANSKAIACCTMFDVGCYPTPMLVCGDLPLPISGTGTAVWGNSLLVGMHFVDLAMGWADIAVSMLYSALTSTGPKMVTDLMGLLKSMGIAKADVVPDFGALAAAAVGLVGQALFDYHGDIEWSYSPLRGLGGSFEVKLKSGNDGTIRLSIEERRGLSSSNLHDEAYVEYNYRTNEVDAGFGGGVRSFGGEEGVEADTEDGVHENRGHNEPGWPADSDVIPDWAELPSL